jgi:hypothetical protein
VKKDFRPSGIRVGFDLVNMVRGIVNPDYRGWEANADVDFYRYYLTVDAGRSERTIVSSTEAYANNGNYMRVGVDVNFLKKDPEKNMLFFGARYAWGTFSESLTITTVDPVWGTEVESFSNQDIDAHWFELTSGIRVKMWKFFWMGYTIRYKFGLQTNEPGELVPYEVPGYGSTAKNTTWGFNYVLLIRVPFRN